MMNDTIMERQLLESMKKNFIMNYLGVKMVIIIKLDDFEPHEQEMLKNLEMHLRSINQILNDLTKKEEEPETPDNFIPIKVRDGRVVSGRFPWREPSREEKHEMADTMIDIMQLMLGEDKDED